MSEADKLGKRLVAKLRKQDLFLDRQFLAMESINKLIELHKQIEKLINEALDTNRKDFDITINNRRFVSSIPFTKDEAKILKKQRRNFIRYVVSRFYNGLAKGKEDPFLLLAFFQGANPADYEVKKSKIVKRLSREEKNKLKTKEAPLSKAALWEVEAEKELRSVDKEYDRKFISYGNDNEN